jgi:carbon storage regulator
MLVLTRKLMEKLYIGNDVCVTVVRLEGGQVRLGIEAPREVAVIRAELLERDERRPPEEAHEMATAAPMALRSRPAVVLGTGIRRRGQSR